MIIPAAMIALSAGTSSNYYPALTFNNASGVSFGLDGSTITASVKTDYQTAGAYLTTAALSNHSHGNPTLALTNLTGTTASASNGFTLSLSAAAPGAGGGAAISADANSQSTGTVNFSASNGITFGLSNNGVMTATVKTDYQTAGAYLTTAALSNHSHGVSFTSGSVAFQTLSFTNSNGISFNSGTQGIFGSHNAITTGALSNHSHGVSFTSGSTVFQTLSFTNSNGFSFNSSTQGVFGSYTVPSVTEFLTTAALSNHSHGNPTLALTNLTGTTASASNGFTLSLSAAAGGGAVSFSGGTSSAALASIVFSNSNGVSFGLNGSTMTGSHNAITTGRASTDAIGLNTAQTNVTWTVNSSGLSLNAAGYAGTGTSATNASVTLNSNGLAISVAAPGGAGAAKSYFAWPEVMQDTSAWTVGQSTYHFQPVVIPYDISISYIRLPLTLSNVGSMASIATAANVTRGMTVSSTFVVGFYTANVGVSSLSLASYATGSQTWIQQARYSAGANGSQWTSGHTISYPNESGGATNFTTTQATSLTNVTFQSSQLSNFTGMRFLNIPLATSLAAGAYWLMYGSSSGISTSGTANISSVRFLASNVAVTQHSAGVIAHNFMGVVSNSSYHFRKGLGSWSTNAMGVLTAALALSGISSSAAFPALHFQLIRQA